MKTLANHLQWIIRKENKIKDLIPTEPEMKLLKRCKVGSMETDIDFV